MIGLIFIGIIMNYLGILQGWLLFWYVIGLIITFGIKFIKVFIKVVG